MRSGGALRLGFNLDGAIFLRFAARQFFLSSG
jgi:hypothetical protein